MSSSPPSEAAPRSGRSGRRRRPLRMALLAAAAAMAVASCTDADIGVESAAGGNVIDPSVFEGEATTIGGESFDLAALADADLVVWFWAPW